MKPLPTLNSLSKSVGLWRKERKMKALARHLTPNAGTLLIVGLFFFAQAAGAIPSFVPQQAGGPSATMISYQGQLTDNAGNPINGDVDMVFRLYYEASDGTAFWTEEHTGANAVPVEGGLFHVLLGSITPLDPAQLTGDVYLGIAVGGDEEMTPRELLTSIYHAVEASGIAGDLDMEGYDISSVGNLAVNGRAGIGTASPEVTLEVHNPDGGSGAIWVSGTRNPSTGGGLNGVVFKAPSSDTDPERRDFALVQVEGDTGGQTALTLKALNSAGAWKAERLRITHDGNVGIGTASPGARLHVHNPDGGGGAIFISGTRDPMPGGGLNAIAFKAPSSDTHPERRDFAWVQIEGEPGEQAALALKALYSAGDWKAERLRITHDGNVSINGSLDMKNHSITNCGALVEGNLQTAEELSAERIERFEQGDVLCWGDGRLEKCSETGSVLVVAVADADGRPIVIGAEPVKVLGPVHIGDLLVASDVPGYAMASESTPAPGTVIAKALEGFDGEQGLIAAMILNH
jgi:hypothetical protein